MGKCSLCDRLGCVANYPKCPSRPLYVLWTSSDFNWTERKEYIKRSNFLKGGGKMFKVEYDVIGKNQFLMNRYAQSFTCGYLPEGTPVPQDPADGEIGLHTICQRYGYSANPSICCSQCSRHSAKCDVPASIWRYSCHWCWFTLQFNQSGVYDGENYEEVGSFGSFCPAT